MTRRGFDSSRKRIAIRGAAVRFTMLRSNKDRTQAAYHLYAFTLFCVMMLGLRKTIVSVENRSSSYLWLVMYQFCKQSEMLLAIWLALEQVHFSSMYAWLGQRYKWTCWYSTPRVLKAFEPSVPAYTAISRGSLFGNLVFTTGSEAAYPRALCQAVAKGVVLECTCSSF